MKFNQKIYYITGDTFDEDIRLQYGEDTLDEVIRIFNEDRGVCFEGFYYLPLNKDYSNEEPIYSLVANYYKDVAPWADALVMDNNDIYFFIDNY